MLWASSAQPQTNHNDDRNMKMSKTKLQMCSTLFGGFSCHHWVTNTVKRDWNDNAIVALNSKIVTTVISSEIPMQRLKSISTKHKSSQS